jgi:DNA-directed RNA polymerase specialized sigma24 family protein
MPETAELEIHRPALTGHCYRMRGSAVEADDASLRTWLYRIATNVCLDELADRSRRARLIEDGPAGTMDDPLVAHPPSIGEICNTHTHTEGLFAISCASRTEVDEIVKRAVAAGGRHAMGPMDHGFVYGWSFYDLNGHHWEVLWMDPKVPQ